MKLLILGASGGCGSWICKLALERGHRVRALVRPSTPFKAPSGAEVLQGQVLDKATLEEAATGCDAVISALGIKRRSRNPWSPLISPEDLTTQVSQHLVDLLPGLGVHRVLSISAAGVGDSINQVNPIIRWMIHNSTLKASYKDLESMERVFRSSNLDWLAIRPTTLTGGKPLGNARVTDYYGLMNRIRRADVAAWMLDALELPRDKNKDRTPMITGH